MTAGEEAWNVRYDCKGIDKQTVRFALRKWDDKLGKEGPSGVIELWTMIPDREIVEAWERAEREGEKFEQWEKETYGPIR